MISAAEARAVSATSGWEVKQKRVEEAILSAAGKGQYLVRLDYSEVDGLQAILKSTGFVLTQQLNWITISWTK